MPVIPTMRIPVLLKNGADAEDEDTLGRRSIHRKMGPMPKMRQDSCGFLWIPMDS
jgi:hypothetical protein